MATPQEIFARLVAPIQRAIALQVARCIINLVDDTQSRQVMQASLLSGETASNLERFQHYGFTSVPFPGAEGIAVFVGANRAHGIVINAEDRRYRLLGMQNGEVALYDDRGAVVHLTRTGIVVSDPAEITATAPKLVLHAINEIAVDAGGTGFVITPSGITYYENGVPVTNKPPAPPQVPS